MPYQVTFGNAQLTVAKAADASGDWPVHGVLSSTRRDRQGDAFTRGCLDYMAAAINGSPLDITDKTHISPGVRDTMGYLNKAEVLECDDGEFELMTWGALWGDDPFTPRVARQCETGRVRMSVDGRIPSHQYVYKAGVGPTATRYVERIDPSNALFCKAGIAQNQDTWVLPIAKAEEDAEAAEVAKATEVSNTKWDGKRSDLPKSSYLVHADNWSDCKLPVYEPDEASPKDAEGHYTRRGPLNANAVRAALSAIGGGRTGTPMDVPESVITKLHSLAEQAGIEVAKAMSDCNDTGSIPPVPTTWVDPGPGEPMQQAVAVTIVEDADDTPPPPAVFADNAPTTSGEARYWEVAEDFEPLCDQLRLTIKGVCALATPEERQAAFVKALADFSATATEAVAEDIAKASLPPTASDEGELIAKAGARHSAADTKGMHSAMQAMTGAVDTLKGVCGCADCGGVVAKAEEPADAPPTDAPVNGAPPSAALPVAKAEGEETMPETPDVTPVAAEATTPPAPAEPVAVPEAAPASEPLNIAKAIENATAPLIARLNQAEQELAILKAAPADGGPEVPALAAEKAEEVDPNAVHVSLADNGVLHIGRSK